MSTRSHPDEASARAMTALADVGALIGVAAESTVSRTVLRAEGVRVVLFAFDTGQELSEHTAAVPVLIQVLDGRLRIRADDRAVELTRGGLMHLATRTPHEVVALEPTRMVLTMLDPRVTG